MINDARNRNAAKVAASILPIFQRQQKHLEKMIIRTGGNLRRKMGKIEVVSLVQLSKEEEAIYKTQVLLKADPPILSPLAVPPPPPAPPDTSWDAFKAALVAALLLSLGGAADDIGGVEDEVWQSRGYAPLQFDPDQVVQNYQSRIGRNISNISDDTLAGVQGAIAAWYISDQPYSDLIDSLGKWFGEGRAKVIGDTEVSGITSQITLEAMNFSVSLPFVRGPAVCS